MPTIPKSPSKSCPVCGRPYTGGRPRSTGPGSQWNHIVGHAVQIGAEQGQTWRQALVEACDMAVTKGYPATASRFGHLVPKDYKDMTVEEASVVITQLHENADFLGVVLKEA